MSSEISPDHNFVVSTMVIVPTTFTSLGVFADILPSEEKRLGVLTEREVFTYFVFSGSAYSVFSFRGLPLQFMAGILSPSSIAEPVFVRISVIKSVLVPSASVLSFSRRQEVG